MADVSITITGAAQLESKLAQYPEISKARISNALKASILEIQKRTDDSGDGGLFQFKTPRSLRTGYLARSFAFGITFGDLYASIGPTADYATYVYNGTRGREGNDFLSRIAEDANADIQKHFVDALDLIVEDIASTT